MMTQSVFLSLLLLVNIAFAQQPVGIFRYNEDIGAVKHLGLASYDDETQVYTITGSGANVWYNKDECHYLYNKISDDFILTADFEFTGSWSPQNWMDGSGILGRRSGKHECCQTLRRTLLATVATLQGNVYDVPAGRKVLS